MRLFYSQVVKLLALLLGQEIRGATRLTMACGRFFPALRSWPVPVESNLAFVDLRVASSHSFLGGSAPEPLERQVIRSIVTPGQVTLDIGAHWGLYTVLLSRCVGTRGQVWAFEPCPLVLAALSQTIKRLDNARIVPLAMSDTSGTKRLFVPPDASMASLTDWTRFGATHTFQIQTARLDDCVKDWLADVPDFVKCDVEGAEALVFHGGQAVLNSRSAPILFFELNPTAATAAGLKPQAAMETLAEFSRAGYQFFLFGIQDGETGLLPFPGGEPALANVLAVPEERMGSLARVPRLR